MQHKSKSVIRSKSIFLLYPSEKLKFIKKISSKLKKEPYGYKTVYIMQYEKQLQQDATLANKFDTIYKKSDFVFALFFKDITNVSVNFEIGFMHGKNDHNLIDHFLALSQPGSDFTDNPYLSSGNAITFSMGNFKEKFTKSESYMDPCALISSFVVNNAKPKKNNTQVMKVSRNNPVHIARNTSRKIRKTIKD